MLIDYEQRHKLIAGYPLFRNLTSPEIDDLVLISFEKTYSPQEAIVSQGDIVDSVYLIAAGEIEVTSRQADSDAMVPILVLKTGDAIGLDPQGFFSQTGERKATLQAISDVILIGWKLDIFHKFLQTHPQFQSALLQISELMLRMSFIKQVDPFANLPVEKISWLANQIEEVTFPVGTVLFRQGEIGDRCYLACSGKVEILIVNQHGQEERFAIIEPPSLFGEIALLANTQRNATARMLEDGKLLILKKDHLQELMKYQSTSESIMSLIVDRCRPVRKPNIEIYQIQTQDNQTSTILKDKENGRYFKLSKEGLLLWQQLDGTKTLQNIVVELLKISRNFTLNGIATTLFNLADAGFVLLPEVESPQKPEIRQHLTIFQKLKTDFQKLTHLSFVFKNVNDKFTSVYQIMEPLFFSTGQIAISLLVFSGLICFGLYFSKAIVAIQATHHLLIILIALFAANLLSVVFHELGHGLAAKFYKRDVSMAGLKVIWFGLGLVVFVDTSDMWLSHRRSRIIVSLAGPYVDMLSAGISSLLALLIPQQEISLFFWLLALTLYYGVYKNLNPLTENDGYSVLKEALNNSYLNRSAYSWLVQLKLKDLKDPKVWKENCPLIIYWSTCLLFLAIGLTIAFAFAYFLQLILPPTVFDIPTFHLMWFLPFLVILGFVSAFRKEYKKLVKR